MTEVTELRANGDGDVVRVAVEGCMRQQGHGTLDAIYASVQTSCEIKGWDAVDLVIIGGDFQAVRNRHDLNVTAMPHKYRKMADFHQYYSGSKIAPYLTIFIGGNHEASNHLFELYHGGWVAPNIYYLGVANVLQFGPLKIAGISGIWKGHDYRKPHFERLPYNEETMRSIYHVRELDTRKLLASRSQVDIGLSHDWPQGIEWMGDHRKLFQRKGFLQEDAKSGKLGSVAAKQVMDHLRPAYWFSAHLHVKYAAFKNYEDQDETPANSKVQQPQAIEHRQEPKRSNDQSQQLAAEDQPELKESPENLNPSPQTTSVLPNHQDQVSAWNNFHVNARKEEAEETAKILQEQQQMKEEYERTGSRYIPQYNFQETYKKVKIGDNCTRALDLDVQVERSPSPVTAIPQLDGPCLSAPRKRRREPSTGITGLLPAESDHIKSIQTSDSQLDGSGAPVSGNEVVNPDALDISMSDDDDDDDEMEDRPLAVSTAIAVPMLKAQLVTETGDAKDASATSSDGGMFLNAGAAPFFSTAARTTSETCLRNSNDKASEQNFKSSELTTNGQSNAKTSRATGTSGNIEVADENMDESVETAAAQDNEIDAAKEEEVSEEMRAQLAALSSTFAEPEKIEISPALPHPETITNKQTRFLALSKCEPNLDFLQLMEIKPLTPSTSTITRPLKLRYDPEWLAIVRVFAPELSLGGSANDRILHRGDTFYRDRIIEEEKWIEENIVSQDLLDIPENFCITAPIFDPDVEVHMRDMPTEVTNPQTTTFCKLIDIPNPFDISEEERQKKMANGPPQESDYYLNRPRGSRGGRGNHRGGRGGRGGRSRGRGR